MSNREVPAGARPQQKPSRRPPQQKPGEYTAQSTLH